jgi:hypothetical protein
MPQQRHIVKRQVLELAVSRGQETHRLHESVSRICRFRLTPILDKYCSALSDTDVIHRIDTLELDLGKILHARLEDDLSESFERALGLKLAKVIAAKHSLGEPGAWMSELALNSHIKPQLVKMAAPAAEMSGGAKVASQLELLAYYVTTGTLPWWADTSTASLLIDNLRFLIEQAPSPLRRAMRRFSRDHRALRRMTLTYDDSLLELLLGVLVPTLVLPLRRFAPKLAETLTNTDAARDWPRSRVRNLVWEDVLGLAGTENVERIGPAEFYRAILHRLARQFGVGWRLFAEDLHHTLSVSFPEDQPWVADLSASLRQELAATATLKSESTPPPEKRLADEMPTFMPELDASFPHKLAATSDPLHPAPSAPVSPEHVLGIDLRFSDSDAIYINNAGLVILWPFLEHFFKHLGLVEEKRFKDDAARQRAIGLLQYVASEEALPPEYLLPLNKLLCGWEVDEIFDFGPLLTELEIEECENLLTAVIAQAPILHEMSVPGFRNSFLLRNGQLSVRDGAWLVRVERETFDVVLDRFPWSINWVKLPWMQAPIQVEW